MAFQRRKVATALAYLAGVGTAASLLTAVPAYAQDMRVEVTGSSIRRVDAEGSLPVTVVTREEIAATGVTTTEQLLAQLPFIDSLGSLNLASGAGLSTYGQSSVSMRGLGSTRTLVLVNGRRIAGFSADDGSVNVNTIPIAAIERVEVLRDGASAIYGSDAIAGVINFILRKDFKGIEVGGQYGQSTRSGSATGWDAYIVGGFGDLAKDKYNVNASFSYNKQDALFGKDRDFAAVGTVLPYFVSGATGQGNIEGVWVPGTGSAANGTWVPGTPGTQFGTSPGRGFGSPLAATNQCELVNMRLNPTNTSNNMPFCNYDTAPFVGLIPESERWNASLNFAWQITPNVQFFAEGLYSEQKNTQTIQGSPVRWSFNQTDALFDQLGIDSALVIKPTNPNYAMAADFLTANGFGALVGQPLAITSRVQDFGGRTNQDESTQWRALAGLRGTVKDQDWEIAYYHNTNEVDGKVIGGYFSLTQYANVINSRDDWNPWSLQQTPEFNAAVASAAYIGPTLSAKTEQDAIDAKISGEIFKLPAGPLSYALGANWNDTSIKLNPAPAQFTGDIAGLGGATVNLDQSRNIWALYGEANIPILKGSKGGDLDGSIAIRYDDYSDFGGTTNYFANLRWQPTKWLLGRVAYGTGFRAPTLSDLYYPVVLGSSAQFNDPVTGEQDLQVNEYTGGNPGLKPEESKQWSLGLVLQPVKQFSLGIDWFQIKLTDIIATPSTQEVVSGNATGNPAYANSVVRDANNNILTVNSVTVNSGDATVQGYDVSATYRDTFKWGTPSVSLMGTYMQKFDQMSPGGVMSHKVGTLVDGDCNPVLDSDTGGVVPRWKHQLQFGYEYAAWAAFLTQNFYNGYRTGCDLDGNQHTIDNQQIWDLQVAWTGVKNLRIAAGVKNLFDEDPPIFIPVSNQFQSGYDAAMYDPRARFWYVQASYKFW
ncbi:MAG: TonB-dependent receptor [Burkholderiales bacterium]|jgi:iron complex outermembrane receptor protein|nr:TonB-dependent receptor [Burkholderiales bacterium]